MFTFMDGEIIVKLYDYATKLFIGKNNHSVYEKSIIFTLLHNANI